MLLKFSNIKNQRAIMIIVLLALSAGVYLGTYGNEFAFDDRAVLLEDPRISTLQSLPAIFTRDYWMIPGTNLYRPLTMLTFAVNHFLSGDSPWSYHLVNQLLHCLNVVLLFLFLENFFPGPDRTGFRFLAAAIFAVHPAATEAVDLIVGRAELLSFAFSLLAFHLYIRRVRGNHSLIASVACYFLGMLSKESAMILPLFLLLYHLYFERRKLPELAVSLSGFSAALAVVVAVRYAVLGAFGPEGAKQVFSGIPWLTVAFTMAKVIAFYWKTALWPAGLQVNYDSNDFPLAASLFDPWVLFSIAVLASLIVLAAWAYRREKSLSFFLLWPFIALFPVMNIVVPTGILSAVRLMYLPLAGYSVALAFLLFLPKQYLDARRPAGHRQGHLTGHYAAVCMYLLLLGALTVSRNGDWKNTRTLFEKELALSPRSVFAMRFLAPVLPLDEARSLLTRAVDLNPYDPFSLSLLGEIYEKLGDHAAAEDLLRRSLVADPGVNAHKQLGIVLSRTGRLDEAEEQFRTVARLKPLWSSAYEDLAIVFLRKGRRENALEMIQKALSLNPGSASAYNLAGTYYKESGDFARAAEAFQKAVELSPDFYEAMYNLADTSEKLDPAVAVQAWERYVRAAREAASERTWVEHGKRRIISLTGGR